MALDMCVPLKDIIFCTCEKIEQINAKAVFPGKLKLQFFLTEYLKTRVIWELHHLEDTYESNEIGSIAMPRKKLKNNLTAEYVLRVLNSKKEIFDFNYVPVEGDNLYVRTEYLYKKINGKNRAGTNEYMSFIYKNSSWIEDFHDPFTTHITNFSQGIVNETDIENHS